MSLTTPTSKVTGLDFFAGEWGVHTVGRGDLMSKFIGHLNSQVGSYSLRKGELEPLQMAGNGVHCEHLLWCPSR